MKDNHEEIQSFLETGINGTYEFSEPSVSITKIGKMFPYFNDVRVRTLKLQWTAKAQRSTVKCILAE